MPRGLAMEQQICLCENNNKYFTKNAGCSLIMLNLKELFSINTEKFSYVLKSFDLILSREIYSVKVKNNS
jgi:hypothetical protein